MALQYISDGAGKVAIGYDSSTGERGFLMKMTNKTGSNTVKGSLVSAHSSVDMSFGLQSNEFDTFGVVYEAGVADGSDAWIWLNGSIAEVLVENNERPVLGYLVIAAATDGRCKFIAIPTGNPNVSDHFREVGHCLESKTQGTDVLVRAHLHFN